MRKPKDDVSWKDVKSVLLKRDQKELVKLIGELYSLNQDSERFIQVKYGLIDQLKPYREIISRHVSPEVMGGPIDISFSKARKAISEYRKAVGDPVGILELMVYYVECGNDFTVSYGDMDEEFYASLESMFSKILQTLIKADSYLVDEYLPRLEIIVDKANGIGWGYSDFLTDALDRAFPEDEI